MSKTVQLLVSALALALVSCLASEKPETQPPAFGIYLTKRNHDPATLAALSYIEPAPEPILSLQDIARYYWSSHTLHLTASGKAKLDTLTIPVHGRSFIVCLNNAPIYAGAFWTPISSTIFSGPTITFITPVPDSIRIVLGYPVDDTAAYDPRDDEDIRAALAAAGRLE